MRELLSGFHPRFEALSALADQTDMVLARTRSGRHVARCAECAAMVREIRALGDAARSEALPGAPTALRSRIEGAVREQARAAPQPSRATPAPDAPEWAPAPALRPTRHPPTVRTRVALRVALYLAAAAAILAALTLPRGERGVLRASAPQRMTFAPGRPAPGATVHVRYTPSPAMAGFGHLVLAVRYADSTARGDNLFFWAVEYDSAAGLRRAADGAMVGDLVLPANFLALAAIVSSPDGMTVDRDADGPWLLVGGDHRGAPSLRSLLAVPTIAGRIPPAVSDTLQRYFPSHPAGYSQAKRFRGEGIFASLVKYFDSAERHYARFDEALGKQRVLDAERLSDMVIFAWQIEEPDEAAKWTWRLVREHPEDPRALQYYASMVHDREMRFNADSARPLVPMLATLLETNGYRDLSNGWARTLVKRYGDAELASRWTLGTLHMSGKALPNVDVDDADLASPEFRSRLGAALRARTLTSCAARSVRYLLRYPREWMSTFCERSRGEAYATLGRIALAEGRVAAASAYADSAQTLFDSTSFCGAKPARRLRGEIMLARGDTVSAARELALALSGGDYQSGQARDSAGLRLRPSVDAGRWKAFTEDAARAIAGCYAVAAKARRVTRTAPAS